MEQELELSAVIGFNGKCGGFKLVLFLMGNGVAALSQFSFWLDYF
jgi:hypothetical protein